MQEVMKDTRKETRKGGLNAKKILYCGDGTLKTAARYLQGILTHLGHRVRYVPSETHLTLKHLEGHLDWIILSDYPASRITNRLQTIILDKIRQGTSFCMIGGYGCFHGKDGNYQESLLAKALPVLCSKKDDRVHKPQGIVMVRKSLQFAPDLDFRKSPVFVGFNRVRPKKESQVILSLKAIEATYPKITFEKEESPLLVFGKWGLGKTAAFTTDIAPHWCGGLVDWGDSRVTIPLPLGKSMELGPLYVRFVQCLAEALL